MKSFYFVSDSFDVGGKESLIVRMITWLAKQDYMCYLMLSKGTDINKKWNDSLKNVGIIYFDFYKYSVFMGNASSIFDQKNEKYFLSTSMSDWIYIQELIRKKRINNVHHLFYVLHPKASRGVVNSSILDKPYQVLIEKKFNRNHLIFMDNETRNFYTVYNSKELLVYRVVELPMEVEKLDEGIIKQRIKNNTFEILTIARLEFPFKGYVLGLIDDFEKLAKENPFLILTIVGDGTGMQELRNKINSMPERIRKQINIMGEIRYDKISGLLKNAKVYVGMGTTLIDAAKEGLISIGATANQMENKSFGFFGPSCNILGLFWGEEGFDKYDFIELIQEVIELSDSDYYDKSVATYNHVKRYDINKIMPQLIGYMNESDVYFCFGTFIKLYDYLIIKTRKLYNYIGRKKARIRI